MKDLSPIADRTTKAGAPRNGRDVDREARTRLADATAAYMRGEMKSFAFDEAVEQAMENSKDSALFDVADWLWRFYDDFKDQSVYATPQGWEYLKRLLAFLTTDHAITKRVRRTWHRGQLVALGSLVVLIATYHPWCNAAHWPLFLATWITAALAARYGTNPPAEPTPEMEELWQFAPFLSEEDWQAHARLLDRYGIPPYDPQEHTPPHRSRLEEWALIIPWGILGFVALPLVLLSRLPPHTETVLLREADQSGNSGDTRLDC